MTMSLLRHNNIVTESSAWRDYVFIGDCERLVMVLLHKGSSTIKTYKIKHKVQSIQFLSYCDTRI